MVPPEIIPGNEILLKNLEQLKTSLFTLNDTGKICQKIESFLRDNLQTLEINIYVLREEVTGFYPYNSLKSSDDRFTLYDSFILWIGERDEIHCIPELIQSSKIIPYYLEEIYNQKHITHVIPFILNSSLIGFILFSKMQQFTKMELECLQELKTFSTMSLSNAGFYEKLIHMTETLEQKVAERTKELEEAHAQLVISEKMASLGVMVAGIAHEINTPIGVINSSSDNLDNNLDFLFSNLGSIHKLYNYEPEIISIFEKIIREVQFRNDKAHLDSREKLKEKKRLRESLKNEGFQDKLIESITLLLVDRNLLFLENDIIQITKKTNEDVLQLIENFIAIKSNLRHIKYSIKHIVKIIRALKHYSHLDQAREEEADISEGIENTLIIMSNQLKNKIEIIKDFKDIPKIICNPDELNQVWTNLIQNGIHAMKAGGTLYIGIYTEANMLCVDIKDTGSGIPPEIISKIWDPFFTTKDQGQGSGLGLGIVKRIIEKHKGTIDVSSNPGNTIFKINLPLTKN